MYSLIPQIFLLVGFGIILWLVIKNLPKIKDEDIKKNIQFSEPRIKKEKIVQKIPIEKIDAKVNSFLEKFLRRFRIILMKIDTYLQKHLETLKSHSKPKSIFKTEENLANREKLSSEFGRILEADELEKVNLELEKEEKEEGIDLIAGVDKITEDILPETEDNKILGADDEVEVLVMGAEETIKKFDLEPEAEIIEEKKIKKRRRKTE